MPRAPELGHKKGWENTKGHSHQQSYEDNTHQEDYTEDHAKENHRDEDQRPSSMAPTTTPDSSMGSLDPLQQPAMPAMLYMPMPPPGTPRSPMFEGANVTEFLERYEDLCSDY